MCIRDSLNALEADPETPYPANSSWDKLMLPGKTAENYNASMQKRLQEQLKTCLLYTSYHIVSRSHSAPIPLPFLSYCKRDKIVCI